MRFNNIRRVVLAVYGCGLISVQSGNCLSPSESGASLPQDSVKTPTEFPELQLMTPVAAPVPIKPEASQESTDKPVEQAAKVQPTSHTASPSSNVMLGTLGRPTPIEQHYGPEIVELCLAAVVRASDVQFVLKRLCPSATLDGASSLTKILVASALNENSGAQAIGKVNISGFPCTTLIEILKMEAAHPDLIPLLEYSHREAADDQLRSNYRKALQSIPTKDNARLMLNIMLRKISSKVSRAALDYKMEFANAERAETNLLKLKATVAEVISSQTQIEQIKLNAVLQWKELDLEACKQKLERFRQELIDLAGIEAVTKFDESLKPKLNT